MKILALTPMLRTWDLDASVRFYTQVLGFICNNRTDAWATLQRDGVEVMLSSPNEHEGDATPAFTGSLFFRTSDVDALWLTMKDRVRACYPVERFDYHADI